jgi:hypothetical protein
MGGEAKSGEPSVAKAGRRELAFATMDGIMPDVERPGGMPAYLRAYFRINKFHAHVCVSMPPGHDRKSGRA